MKLINIIKVVISIINNLEKYKMSDEVIELEGGLKY
jgi:hypothetical protein